MGLETAETCGNCRRLIGAMEKVFVFDGEVVCFDCNSRLTGQASPIAPQPMIAAAEKTEKSSRGVLVFMAAVLTIGVGVFLALVAIQMQQSYAAGSAKAEKLRTDALYEKIKFTSVMIQEYREDHGGRFPKDLKEAGEYSTNIIYVGADLPSSVNYDDRIVVCYFVDPQKKNIVYEGIAQGYAQTDYIPRDGTESLNWKESNDAREKRGRKRLSIPVSK